MGVAGEAYETSGICTLAVTAKPKDRKRDPWSVRSEVWDEACFVLFLATWRTTSSCLLKQGQVPGSLVQWKVSPHLEGKDRDQEASLQHWQECHWCQVIFPEHHLLHQADNVAKQIWETHKSGLVLWEEDMGFQQFINVKGVQHWFTTQIWSGLSLFLGPLWLKLRRRGGFRDLDLQTSESMPNHITVLIPGHRHGTKAGDWISLARMSRDEAPCLSVHAMTEQEAAEDTENKRKRKRL